jgi:hypothetical protein
MVQQLEPVPHFPHSRFRVWIIPMSPFGDKAPLSAALSAKKEP